MSKSDPGARIDHHCRMLDIQERLLKDYQEQGLTYVTQLTKRSIAGHKAAITRIQRQRQDQG